jgi:hypothetical protein
MWDPRITFPNIRDVKVEVLQKRNGSKIEPEHLHHAVYTLENMEKRHHCSNLNCTGEGFSIEQILMGMVARKETHWEDNVVLCKGHEPSPGKGYFPSCGSYWKVKVDVEYM